MMREKVPNSKLRRLSNSPAEEKGQIEAGVQACRVAKVGKYVVALLGSLPALRQRVCGGVALSRCRCVWLDARDKIKVEW